MKPIRLASCMSEAVDPFCRAIAGYLTAQLGHEVAFVDDIPWQDRLAYLVAGEIEIGWICGVDYVLSTSLQDNVKGISLRGRGDAFANVHNDIKMELLAAPVISGERYQGRPVYFSDVVVHRERGFRFFKDLYGSRWVYNEPGSFSGYRVMMHRVKQLVGGKNFFGLEMESGAHTRSLQMVLTGQADVTAIDSMVLDQVLTTNPEWGKNLQVLESLGPYPVPPWVISRNLHEEVRKAVGSALWEIAGTSQGQGIFSEGVFEGIVPVTDSDYDPIREVVLFDC